MSNLKVVQSAKPRCTFFDPTYTAPELAPFSGRPGAMDAYRLPSLALGQLVWPKGHVAQQVERKP